MPAEREMAMARKAAAGSNPKVPWWRRQGLVMAGGWHPLTGRLRAGGKADNEEELYAWEYTEAHIRRLKELGITLLVSQCDRGLGPTDQERDQDLARRQAALCHKHGIHHGSYMANTVYYESMLKDYPDCQDWVVRTHDGRMVHYGGEQTWRWVGGFNSPGWLYTPEQNRARVLKWARRENGWETVLPAVGWHAVVRWKT